MLTVNQDWALLSVGTGSLVREHGQKNSEAALVTEGIGFVMTTQDKRPPL